MKKVIIASSMLLVLPFAVSAQTATTTSVPTPTVAPLPDPGFVPGDFFYFFDRLGEGFNFFYTFNSESKARLALQYAQERAAEIDVLLKTKTIDSQEVKDAKADFNKELSRASSVILDAKNKGVDVSASAREINSRFEESRDMLKVVLHNRQEDLKSETEKLRGDINQADKNSDAAERARLEARLKHNADELNKLSSEEDTLDNDFTEEKNNLEASMGDQQSAESQITNAKRARIQFVAEMTTQGAATSTAVTQALASFDELLKKAAEAYSNKDYENAKGYAKDAKRLLNDSRNENDTEDLEESFFEDSVLDSREEAKPLQGTMKRSPDGEPNDVVDIHEDEDRGGIEAR